jgi:hypothetical protein
MTRTALVTGASGGIGWELAKLFAGDGLDVALVGRYPARLEELAQELEERYGVSAFVVSKDLGRDEAAKEVVWMLAEDHGREADVLVNSAGFNQFGPFAESSATRMDELMHVNMLALTSLTRQVLPGMIRRGWGRVVNLASNAAFQPGPLMAVYYATKAYVLSLSIALNDELRGTGVRVTAICPGPTATGFQAVAGMEGSRLVAGKKLSTAAEVADWGYAAIKRGRPYAVQGAKWQTLAFGTRFLPRTTAARIARRAQERVER